MLKLLFNYGGDQASAINNDSGSVSFDSDFDETSIIASGRHTRMRTESSASAKRIVFDSSGSRDYRYLVITRADWGATEGGQNMLSYRTGGVTASVLSPIDKDNLMGPYQQDYAVEAWPTGNYSEYGVQYEQVSGNEPMQINQMCVAEDFDLGVEPSFDTSWEVLDEGQRYFTPMMGHVRYRTESRIKMTWANVAKAEYDSLKDWPHLLRWPFYLFDSAADILPDKLEHVLCETYAVVIGNNGRRDIEMILRRLEHYG